MHITPTCAWPACASLRRARSWPSPRPGATPRCSSCVARAFTSNRTSPVPPRPGTRCSGNPAWASTLPGKWTSGGASAAPSSRPTRCILPPRPTTPMPWCCCGRRWPIPISACVPSRPAWTSPRRTPSARRAACRSPNGCSAMARTMNSTGSKPAPSSWPPRPAFRSWKTSSTPCVTCCAHCWADHLGHCLNWRAATGSCRCLTGRSCRTCRRAYCSAARTSALPNRRWRRNRRWWAWPRPTCTHR